MKCKKAKKLMSLYLDAELPGSLLPDLKEHLNSCSLCRADYEFFRNLEGMLPETGVNPSVYFKRGFWDKVKKEEERKLKFFGRLVFAPAYAAVSLFLMITFFSGSVLYAYKSKIKDSSIHRELVSCYIKEGVLGASLTPLCFMKFLSRGEKCIRRACCLTGKDCRSESCDEKCCKPGRGNE
ncbi:MAG: zf-HC2 domain-containing protein [bacterium]